MMGSKSVPTITTTRDALILIVRYTVFRFDQSYTLLVPMYCFGSFCWVGRHFSFMGVN